LPDGVVKFRAWCLDRVEAVTGIEPVTPIAQIVHDRAVEYLRCACQLETLRQLHAALELAQTVEEISHCLALDSARADVSAPALALGG